MRERTSYGRSMSGAMPWLSAVTSERAPASRAYCGKWRPLSRSRSTSSLGNHDFYNGSVVETRARVGSLVRQSENLVYLTQEGVVELTPSTARSAMTAGPTLAGPLRTFEVQLSDFVLIEELARYNKCGFLDKRGLRRAMESLAAGGGRPSCQALPDAVSRYREVIAVTHVPPFREAAWHQGKPSGDDFLPYFASKIVGDVMLGVMRSHPNAKLLAPLWAYAWRRRVDGAGQLLCLDRGCRLRKSEDPADFDG